MHVFELLFQSLERHFWVNLGFGDDFYRAFFLSIINIIKYYL